MMKTQKRFVPAVTVTAGLAAALNLYGPAGAVHESTGIENRDNNDQEVDFVDLTPGGAAACAQGMSELDRSEITTSDGTGDIRCYDANYGNVS